MARPRERDWSLEEDEERHREVDDGPNDSTVAAAGSPEVAIG
jgi:hypothetical protein